MKTRIRDYKNTDFNEVEGLWITTGMGSKERGDSPDVISRTLENGGKLLILENEDTLEIIGTSWLTNDGRRIYLHHFGVKPEYQGQGFSKILLLDSLKFARAIGLQIKLEVHESNKKAIGIYEKGGFKYLGDYDVYIVRNYDYLKDLI